MAPRRVPLHTLVQVAGRRWVIEQAFGTSIQEIGLDQFEVRTYAARYRFMTLTRYANAFLAAMRARQSPRKTGLRPAPRARLGSADTRRLLAWRTTEQVTHDPQL